MIARRSGGGRDASTLIFALGVGKWFARVNLPDDQRTSMTPRRLRLTNASNSYLRSKFASSSYKHGQI